MMLYSNAIKNPGGITYVPFSLTPYGNDGNHYNDSINKPPNAVVSQLIANAIHYSSDIFRFIHYLLFHLQSQ